MSEDQGSGDSWAFSESRDFLEGKHEREAFLPPHPGEIASRDDRRTLTAMYQAFERAARSGRIRSTDLQDMSEHPRWHDLRQALASEALAYAVAEGHAPRIRHIVGSREPSADVSGLRAIGKVDDLITQDPAMFYIFGQMGAGKTMLGTLLCQRWQRHNPHGEIASNIRTLDPAIWLNEWHAVDQWIREDEETVLAGEQTPKLYFLDEGSSVASGRGKQGYETAQKLGRLTYKIRKFGGSLIIIGHDGKDVSPIIRELSIAVEKTGTKSARFYQDVKNRRGRDPITPELTGIPLPDTEWQPNTYDMADFYWSEENREDAADAREAAIYTVIRGREQGLSTREIADFVPYGKTWVADRAKEFEEEGMFSDVPDRVEAATA